MKPRIASFLLFSLFALSCSLLQPTPTHAPETSSTPDPLDTAWDDRSIFKEGLVPSAQWALDELDGATVYHIELDIADDLSHVKGSEEVRYTNTESEPLTEARFRLFPNILGGKMEVANLLVNEATATPRYDLRNSVMVVPFAAPLAPGESAIISMDFSVEVPRTVELNYGVLAYDQDVLALAHAYPMVAVFDDEGWNAEIPPQEGDVTYADASFFIVKVTVPTGVTVVTSGRRVGFTEAEQTQSTVVASGPARDFYLAASPKYEETVIDADGILIRSYTTADFGEGSQYLVETAARAVKIFSERYAPYPYTELDFVSTPTLALGIEYPGMIVITSWIYDTQNGAANEYLEATVAHEVGHQWFYNLVGDDQLDDPWLDESLTQFITLQYFIDTYGSAGSEGFEDSLEFRWDMIARENIPIGLPVEEYDGATYSGIVYGRGPLFFVALRDIMGQSAFDAFLKDYTQSLTWKISTPETLQSLAEKHCNCELDDIFNEWVYP
ncbi:MAG TPA: M1 family metallopeptidase [Anaerolineales bacterium]|nr:M1 family metallopeptidase [Anaerolineales bacterium]HMR98985.1 M1 family metallopeptidase [Anaerolineales bacterium]HNQ94394.1 M1 family metallopeptidase [Anaerolineales bacterium]HNS61294.1 M1 family metallopeptidase [Anaerolineales bacterium]